MLWFNLIILASLTETGIHQIQNSTNSANLIIAERLPIHDHPIQKMPV
jgi:hypothetical protein